MQRESNQVQGTIRLQTGYYAQSDEGCAYNPSVG